MYQRLVAAGILPGGRADSHCEEQEEANSIKPVDFSQPETLKIAFTSRHQPGLVALQHSGIACSSCGAFFLPEEHMKYRQHLEWNFQQNRCLKDSGDNQSRGWYFNISDWMQYEEIEDPEETGGSTMDARFGDMSDSQWFISKEILLQPQSSRPGKFQCGPLQWIDVGHPNMRCGRWELEPNNPWRHERTSASITQVHLGSHPGPNQRYGYTFHEILGPEFQVVNNSGGINQQRPLHFQCYAWFKGCAER